MASVDRSSVRSQSPRHDIELGSLETCSGPTTLATPALSTSSAPLDNSADEVPNLRYCAICLSAFLVMVATCGAVFSFGVYQELYQSMALVPGTPFSGASPAAIDVIGTLAAAFETLPAPLVTATTRRYTPQRVILSGAALAFTGSMLASYSRHLWQFILTQGLFLGVATCCAYLPAVTVSPTWYGPRRGLAMGIIVSGTGIGGLMWSPLLHALNERFGFRNALRVSGAITTALIVAGGCVLDWDPATKRRLEAEKRRLDAQPRSRSRTPLWTPLIDWRIAASSTFVLQLIPTFFQSAAYFTPVFFFSAYARTLHYTPSAGANFIAATNAANAISKVVVGVLADRYGHLTMLAVTTCASAVFSLVFWLPSTLVPLHPARGLFVAYALLYGASSGPFTSLFPACIVEIFGPHAFAQVNGVLYMARGAGSLVGTPTAGALVRGSAGEAAAYCHMAVMVSVLLAAAGLGTVWMRVGRK